MFCSSYGQTFFISVFAGEIMESYGLTDGQWGAIYAGGTLTSAICMIWAGGLSDRFRVRGLAYVVVPGLILACLAMAMNIWGASLVICVFLLRFFGQGMTFQLAAVAMARWFSVRRGLALSISTLGIAAGQAILPLGFAALLALYDWRLLWAGAAGMIAVAFPVILWLLSQERTPQSLAKQTGSTGMGGRHWTRADVIKSSFFWMITPLLIGPPAWGTALLFQQVHIADVKGWDLVSYLSLIPILTVVSVAVTLASGQLIDRFGTARMMQVYLLPFVMGFVILAFAQSLGLAGLAFVVFGVGMGLQSTLITAFWAEFFGTKHIGAIKATSTSLMVFGSAIGPWISGGLIDRGYSFPDQMIWIAAYFGIAMTLAWGAITRAKTALRDHQGTDPLSPLHKYR